MNCDDQAKRDVDKRDRAKSGNRTGKTDRRKDSTVPVHPKGMLDREADRKLKRELLRKRQDQNRAEKLVRKPIMIFNIVLTAE
jgi:hypothetical protein